MCISANMNQTLSHHLPILTIDTAVGAMAGLISPIGAAGGALIGVVSYAITSGAECLYENYLGELDNGADNDWVFTAVKIACVAFTLIVSVIASMFAASLIGI